LPIIIDLKKPSIKARHWEKVIEISGVKLNYENEDNFFLSDLIEAGLLRFAEDIVDITDSADK
jgi:dynein heavy chain